MSTFIKIPGINPPSTRPRVDLADGLLPDQGAMLLVEPMHPLTKWASGLPVDGMSVPNLAADGLRALTGVGEPAAMASVVVKDLATANISLKRSSKGGVNAARTVASTVGTGMGFKINYPGAVLQHVKNNPAHNYYASLWMRVTANTAGTHAWSGLSLSSTRDSASGYLFALSNTAVNYPGLAARLGAKRAPESIRTGDADSPTYPTPWFSSVGAAGYANPSSITLSAAEGVGTSKVFGVGGFDPWVMAHSNIVGGTFYRSYLEDLTVSGRSYAEVEALDYAAYTKQVMTAGGRYYGDAV